MEIIIMVSIVEVAHALSSTPYISLSGLFTCLYFALLNTSVKVKDAPMKRRTNMLTVYGTLYCSFISPATMNIMNVTTIMNSVDIISKYPLFSFRIGFFHIVFSVGEVFSAFMPLEQAWCGEVFYRFAVSFLISFIFGCVLIFYYLSFFSVMFLEISTLVRMGSARVCLVLAKCIREWP
ncbi:MAG: hypothetical protein B6U76_05840 [Desulfurococcales archaeon ex4484_217_2]|nr:MAG: hypothetical protein B6U76_05840 [Desulfurococcales archaeon ex4484_217_2]